MSQHWRIITGDSRASLAAMPDCSVHCCVTSPPYWGLRDYGVDGQMGLEKSPAEFVAGMVGVFREVRRVLRGDGTCWVNIGDSYCNTDKWGGGGPNAGKQTIADDGSVPSWNVRAKREPFGLKPKDLCGVPWRLALALQDDGWYLRQDIIWAKPNPMPESVTDRCTKSHEYIFLLSKSPRYHYDADGIREPHAAASVARAQNPANPRLRTKGGGDTESGVASLEWQCESVVLNANGANARSVWTIPTQPSGVPHYAMFPEELPRRCIKAGCPVGGVVLDPFSGMATTGKVALEMGRSYVGIELNPKYAEDSRARLREVSPLLAMEAA